jgi:hypothetical protein
MNKKTFIIFICLVFLICCETLETQYQSPTPRYTTPRYEVVLVKHPDLDFAPTNPDSIVIYEGFLPIHNKYFVIGKIGILEFGYKDSYRGTIELKEKAAQIGGHALILANADTKTTEIGGGITGISVPRYFWWDRPYYMGTDYYFYELPKTTVSNYSRIYFIVKFVEQTNKELKNEAERILKLYPLAILEKKEIFKILEEKEKNGKLKYNSLEQLCKISHETFVDRLFIYYGEAYPFADKEDVMKLLLEGLENDKLGYTLEGVMKISHQRKIKKKDDFSWIDKYFKKKK